MRSCFGVKTSATNKSFNNLRHFTTIFYLKNCLSKKTLLKLPKQIDLFIFANPFFKMKKQFFIYFFILISSTVAAQVFEIGLFAGGSNYVGDIGPSYYINPNFPAAGGIAKFNFTPKD